MTLTSIKQIQTKNFTNRTYQEVVSLKIGLYAAKSRLLI